MLRLLLALSLTASTIVQASDEPTLLWGDTHLHTSYSFDAFTNGNLTADPETAYRYAMGLPVIHPYHRARVQIGTPLDFLVVSDHAEFMGSIRHIYNEGVPGDDIGWFDLLGAQAAAWILTTAIDVDGWGLKLFRSMLPEGEEASAAAVKDVDVRDGSMAWIPPLPAIESAAWKSITETADSFNKPGEFTALIGWEWSSIPGGSNLHRIVLSDSDGETARQYQPYSYNDSPYPEDLWAWLEQTSATTGADFLAIPHNSNISKGYMYDNKSLRGKAYSADDVARRMRWEKLSEITQIKGDSETHPDLSPADQFADFETYPYYIQRYDAPYTAAEGDYIRSALKRGLAMEQTLGQNPFQFGVIGSTDAHTGLASAEEDNFHGKLARDSVPENKNLSFGDASKTSGWAMSASGLAAVWAQENTREAIFAAMKRREVYATSGPRIGVQFFGGWNYQDLDVNGEDIYSRATASGVPMGGELSAATGEADAPGFIVRAYKDPVGGNLDRVQIVKGWLDSSGATHERIYNIAWSGERALDATGELPEVGNTVDIATGQYTNDIGDAQLSAYWQDPDFDPSQSAFYYARVLQIPTPRHSLYDALALGVEHAANQPDTIQERAYTSAIWYQP
jgi:uncharacterized protein DUF3604